MPDAALIRGSVDNHVEAVCLTRHDVSLLLGHRCQGPPQLNGLSLGHGEVVATHRGCEHTLSLAGPYQCWMVHLSHPLLAQLSGVWRKQLFVRRSPVLEQFIESIFPLVPGMPEESLQGWSSRLVELIANSLAQADEAGALEAISTRRQAALLAARCIAEKPTEPWPLEHLAESVAVSQRTLRYGFQEVFGINPTEYLRAYRLTRVRRLLREAREQSTSVARVAARWGFWHMPRFAGEYRRFFGELPSDTLRRAPVGSAEFG